MLNLIDIGQEMWEVRVQIHLRSTRDMKITSPIFTKFCICSRAVLGDFSVLNLIDIGQEMWEVRVQIHLRSTRDVTITSPIFTKLAPARLAIYKDSPNFTKS